MPSSSERLNAALSELSQIDSTIEAFETRIEELKARKNELETGSLIELFNEAGIVEAVFAMSGQKAKRGLVATGSLQKDPALRPQAIDWLVGAGYGESFENKVVASYARGNRDRALTVFNSLRASDNAAKVSFAEDINHNTLKKIAREHIQNGLPIPLTLLGVDVTSRVRFQKR